MLVSAYKLYPAIQSFVVYDDGGEVVTHDSFTGQSLRMCTSSSSAPNSQVNQYQSIRMSMEDLSNNAID